MPAKLLHSRAPLVAAADLAGQEILYPSEAFSKLDTFEGVNLEEADKKFSRRIFSYNNA